VTVINPPRSDPPFINERGGLSTYGLRTLSLLYNGVRVQTVNITPASVAANVSAEQSFSVALARTGDFVSVTPPSLTAGTVIGGCRASANGTVQITFGNLTGGGLTPPSGDYVFFMARAA